MCYEPKVSVWRTTEEFRRIATENYKLPGGKKKEADKSAEAGKQERRENSAE